MTADISLLRESRLKTHVANVTIRTVYIKQNKRVYCFIYNINAESGVVKFAGTIWKHFSDQNPIRRKTAYNTTQQRFEKKPYQFVLFDSNKEELCKPLALNFYQFRRLENILPQAWFHFHQLSHEKRKEVQQHVLRHLNLEDDILDKEITEKEELRDIRDANRKVLKDALKEKGLSINDALLALNEHQELLRENRRLRLVLKDATHPIVFPQM